MRSLTNQDMNSPFKIHYSTFERSDTPKPFFRVISHISRSKNEVATQERFARFVVKTEFTPYQFFRPPPQKR
jgi:hypothetical protein